ncbi:MAG: aspartate aminotransferase family protein [Candidatus Auribacterota bacterium]
MKTVSPTASLYESYVLPTYGREGLTFVRGEGSYLFDSDGNRYLDLYPGWGTGCLGHCHPYVVEQVTRQLHELIHVPNNYYNPWQAELAKRLADAGLHGYTFFANSGAEANEGAIKLARRFGNRTGRYEIITFLKSFHGRTLAAITATGQPKYQQGFEPLPEGFKYAQFGDMESVRKTVTAKTCAVLFEPVQGEGGINIASDDFFKEIQAFCNEHNILLMLDEVQTGMGRTGNYFGYQTTGLNPDVVTLAKALGGGFPIGAMMVAPHLKDMLPPGTHASTYGGNPLVCRAALAVMDVFEKENILDNVRKQSLYVRQRLNAVSKSTGAITGIRIQGLMIGIDLTLSTTAVKQACTKRNVLINTIGENTIRLLPALNITEQELASGLDVFEDVLRTEGTK